MKTIPSCRLHSMNSLKSINQIGNQLNTKCGNLIKTCGNRGFQSIRNDIGLLGRGRGAQLSKLSNNDNVGLRLIRSGGEGGKLRRDSGRYFTPSLSNIGNSNGINSSVLVIKKDFQDVRWKHSSSVFPKSNSIPNILETLRLQSIYSNANNNSTANSNNLFNTTTSIRQIRHNFQEHDNKTNKTETRRKYSNTSGTGEAAVAVKTPINTLDDAAAPYEHEQLHPEIADPLSNKIEGKVKKKAVRKLTSRYEAPPLDEKLEKLKKIKAKANEKTLSAELKEPKEKAPRAVKVKEPKAVKEPKPPKPPKKTWAELYAEREIFRPLDPVTNEWQIDLKENPINDVHLVCTVEDARAAVKVLEQYPHYLQAWDTESKDIDVILFRITNNLTLIL